MFNHDDIKFRLIKLERELSPGRSRDRTFGLRFEAPSLRSQILRNGKVLDLILRKLNLEHIRITEEREDRITIIREFLREELKEEKDGKK
ncbi:hypothetical protein LCGC14_0641200 [marine sediment metagenome]|uniref:Uncharacterized protein n=1 Tax=marine sediment metagenome TaxID=412755 RepID=A0A0F9QYZ3_9ZZZZ|nr:hypothetical protein [archaeon]